jgi:hypothetical protein
MGEDLEDLDVLILRIVLSGFGGLGVACCL